MQNIAAKISFSETAFIKKVAANVCNIRFFTPKIEISLCGHATLASSKIVFDTISVQDIIFINNENIDLKFEKENSKIMNKNTSFEFS